MDVAASIQAVTTTLMEKDDWEYNKDKEGPGSLFLDHESFSAPRKQCFDSFESAYETKSSYHLTEVARCRINVCWILCNTYEAVTKSKVT